MPAPKYIAALYGALASLAVLLLAPLMPPLENADEAAHVYRADQVSHLGLLGVRIFDGEFGGLVDSGLIQLQYQAAPLRSPASPMVTSAIDRPLGWGVQIPAGYPNTAINPPFFYIPAAAAAAALRWAGIALPNALVLMRLATGLATIAIAALAISLASDAALWFYAVLLLPMSTALTAAVSQDGPFLACTALAAALLRRLQTQSTPYPGQHFAAVCALLTMVALARPPYAAFAILVLATPVRLPWRIAGIAGIAAALLAWSARTARYFPLPLRPEGLVSPSAQLLMLATHPWRCFPLALRTALANDGLIGRSFIGQLGWLDIGLPRAFRIAAWAGLGLVLLLTLRGRPLAKPRRAEACAALAILGAAAAVALTQYMTWTVVGSPVIEGIQGRYFLPSALMLGLFARRAAAPAPAWLIAPVLLLPVAGIAVSVRAVVLRYYISPD